MELSVAPHKQTNKHRTSIQVVAGVERPLSVPSAVGIPPQRKPVESLSAELQSVHLMGLGRREELALLWRISK